MDITASILLTMIFLILIVCLYNWLLNPCDYWTSRGIPSVPGPLPIFGNTFSMFCLQDNITMYALKVYNAYRGKSMVGLYKFGHPTLLIRDPDLVKTVLETKFNSFQNNENALDPEMDPLFAHDPLFSRGQAWKDVRLVFVTAFSTRRLKDMSLVVADVCKKLGNYLAEKIKDKDSFDVEAKSLFSRYSVEVAAGAVFSVQGNSFADDYKGTFLDNMEILTMPNFFKALKNLTVITVPSLGKFLKTRFVPSCVDQYFRSVVKHLAVQRLKTGVSNNDVLQLMLDMEKSGRILRDQTLSHSFSFVMDSYETSSVTLSAICYCLAKYQEIQSRVREEVKMVLEKYGGLLTYDSIKEMTYLNQVMEEAIRMYPVGGVMGKVCTKLCRLEGSDGLAVDVEPGTTVLISLLGLQMEPNFWDNPERFDPERFEKSNIDGRHKFIHLPFGRGPRACPGRSLAIIQMKAAVATILRNYQIERSPKLQEPIRMDPMHFFGIPVGGFWIRLRSLRNN